MDDIRVKHRIDGIALGGGRRVGTGAGHIIQCTYARRGTSARIFGNNEDAGCIFLGDAGGYNYAYDGSDAAGYKNQLSGGEDFPEQLQPVNIRVLRGLFLAALVCNIGHFNMINIYEERRVCQTFDIPS